MADATPPAAAPPARPNLLSLDDALARLLAVARDRLIAEVEKLDTFDALGRVLARPVVSGLDVPPADNSAMDGYALRVADVPVVGTRLPVSSVCRPVWSARRCSRARRCASSPVRRCRPAPMPS